MSNENNIDIGEITDERMAHLRANYGDCIASLSQKRISRDASPTILNQVLIRFLHRAAALRAEESLDQWIDNLYYMDGDNNGTCYMEMNEAIDLAIDDLLGRKEPVRDEVAP